MSFAIGRYQFETLELSEKMVVKVRVKQRITLHSGNGELDDDDED